MTGTDNEFHYTGVAFLKEGDELAIWKKKQGSQLETIVKAFRAIYLDTVRYQDEAEYIEASKYRDYRIEEARRCLNCNRLLTNPVSILTGIGPICGGRD